ADPQDARRQAPLHLADGRPGPAGAAAAGAAAHPLISVFPLPQRTAVHLRYPLAPIALSALFAGPAVAAGLGVNIEIPRLNVSEYHRPYVAAWIEKPDNTVATTLAVWYDIRTKTNNPEGEGTKWLKDLRQWWRRTGRELSVPIDGVTGATKPAG